VWESESSQKGKGLVCMFAGASRSRGMRLFNSAWVGYPTGAILKAEESCPGSWRALWTPCSARQMAHPSVGRWMRFLFLGFLQTGL